MVSIIIPMYNAGKYICDCVESIENQTYKNIEIIIVNDGSTDDSYTICNKLCARYKNIRLIDVPNGGVSKARNIGLSHAKGEYIQFVDADDTVHENCTHTMLTELKNRKADLIVSAYWEYGSHTKRIVEFKTADFVYRDEIFSELLKTNRLWNSPCNKLYKKERISVGFPENLTLGEDLIFNLSYANQCEKMCFINTPLYHYIARPASLTTKYSARKFEDIVLLDQICCLEFGLQEIYRDNLIDNLYDLFCVWAKGAAFKQREEKNLIDLLCNNDYLVSRCSGKCCQGSLKKRIFAFLVKRKAGSILLVMKKLISIKN